MTERGPGRVTYLISDFEGGTANHLSSVVDHLDRDAWDPLIVSIDPRAKQAAAHRPVRVVDGSGPLHRFPVAQLRELAVVRRLLKSRPTDVLHTYFFWPIVYGRLLKAIGAVDTLVENREDEGFDWGPREYRILRATRSWVDRVIAVSSSVRAVVLEREGLDPDRVEVVYNAIEDVPTPSPERIDALRAEWGLDATTPVVGYVGNFERPVKGMRYLLEAVPLVRREVPDVRFFIVGRGPDVYRERARELGVADVVHFTGPTADVNPYYGLFDVSVLPSLSEGLSLTILESMAHGVPVVVTDVGGNPEVVEDPETGRLVGSEDPPALASAISELLTDPETRRVMGLTARQRFERKFLQPVAAGEYARIYARRAAERRTR